MPATTPTCMVAGTTTCARIRTSTEPMDWLTDPLALELFQRALIEAVLMGATCGAIGAYVVLRRLAFIGDALSHAVFPGVVVAYLLGLPVFAGARLPRLRPRAAPAPAPDRHDRGQPQRRRHHPRAGDARDTGRDRATA